jgi:LmbE family N-acetylglucosaminyl deacetylase
MLTNDSQTVLVIAPHPDDETLGCGGTLLRHVERGDRVHWLIFTSIKTSQGFSEERVNSRAAEIDAVVSAYGFAGVHHLNFPTMMLDTIPKGDLVGALGSVVKKCGAQILYIPYRNDVHSDHAAVFDAAAACAKTFRYPTVRSVRAYETLSETEFGIRPDDPGFRPNLFIDIADHLDKKLEIMAMYASELGPFPFPRSEVMLRALAQLRGVQSGMHAAEAFMLLKEIQ